MELRSSASEAIWRNLEITEKILGFLHEPGEDKNPMSPSSSSKKDLLAACLVSKAFFLDPALNILWRHLWSLKPVFCLFPTFQKAEHFDNWSLTGAVSNDHLQRILFYTRRIRSVRISNPQRIPNAFTILSYCMQPLQPFLPLTELILDVNFINLLHPVLFVMPLTLTTISITCISPASRITVVSLLQHLSSNHESLKYLTLTGSLDDAFLNLLLECSSLRSLILTSSETVFSVEFLRDLSDSLTSLETLSLNDLRSNGVGNLVPTVPPAVIFASLLELTLTGGLPSISAFLSVVKAPQLREITLSFSSPVGLNTPEAAIFAECVAQVANVNDLEGKGSLRSVKISHSDPTTCIDLSAFDALFALRPTIQVLHLHPNRLYLEIAKDHKSPIHTRFIYPNLVDLRVTFQQPALPNGAYFTPMVLERLVRVCPNLKTLHISANSGNEDDLEIDLENTLDIPPHGLQILVFHHLPRNWSFSVSLAVVLVRYLDYLFPTLASAEYCQDGLSEGGKKWWKGVQGILKMCQGNESARRRRLVAVD